ncbi:MAG TPA: FecR domain-containing protein [Pyrinomonadaceae bacterium]|nr:FecR domain-containing protein [Pyrinomonadaceae bacterium]HMP66806.1 FecR domain-containing protein [Pyrinomonadaceae bacterium]
MKSEFRIVLCMAIAAFVAVPLAAQSSITSALGDKYVISAKAGGTNLIEGEVTVMRTDGTSGLLVKGMRVEVGDRVSTGVDGRAEILLNPGSYLRMGPNSVFEFVSTSLDDLKVRIHSGSVIFEVFASNDFVVDVELDGNAFKLIDSGVYRINAGDNTDSIVVIRGRAQVKDGGETTTVRGGRVATLDGDDVAIARTNRRDTDGLEEWSRQRSRELVRMTSSLRPRDFREPLMNAFYSDHWNLWDSFGLWVFNPYRGGWCFLPFGRGWRSPYGFWYGYDIWSYRLPWEIYYSNPRPRQPSTQPGTMPPKADQGPSQTPRRSAATSAPPYIKMESGSSNTGRRTSPNFPPMTGPPVSAPPVFSPPVALPPKSDSAGSAGRGRRP